MKISPADTLPLGLLGRHPEALIVVPPWCQHTYPSKEIDGMLGGLGTRSHCGTSLMHSRWESIRLSLSQKAATGCRVLNNSPGNLPNSPLLELYINHPMTGLSAQFVQSQF